ncbi:MAG TPA: sugar phosphate nucleotidyltransferase [Thermoanaerobaculia bacterium]|jgi:NDP-sugar pyrophosphorylase family protein
MKVVILCGGLGTRLGGLTRDIPKPMLAVAGRPYLEYVIESFLERGFREFVLLTGYRSDVIEEHFATSPLHFEFSREDKPLGTGGALLQARPLLGDRFLLTYGDVLRRFDYDRFVREHEHNALAVYPKKTHGNAEVEEGRVIRYDKQAPELPYIDAGFAVIENSALDLLEAVPRGSSGSSGFSATPRSPEEPPLQEPPLSFEEIVYAELARRLDLAAEIVDHEFFDIGTPEELTRTCRALERS